MSESKKQVRFQIINFINNNWEKSDLIDFMHEVFSKDEWTEERLKEFAKHQSIPLK